MKPLHTPLTDLLGIDVPVLQSGMRQVAGPERAAEVSRGGGLGILAGVRIGPDELRAQIHRLRERTDRPFGVNLWLHPDLQPPLNAAATRFVATRESKAPAFWKRATLEKESEETLITNVYSGLYARGIRNRFAEDYQTSGAPVLPGLLQSTAAQDIYAAASAKGDGDYYPMLSGQSLGLIRDLPGAAEVVERVVEEARAAMARLPR